MFNFIEAQGGFRFKKKNNLLLKLVLSLETTVMDQNEHEFECK